MLVRTAGEANILVTQEDHTELSGQFAAHWGNGRFDELRPYESVMFAVANHDGGYRELEWSPPINIEKRRPVDLTEPAPSQRQLDAHARHIEWMRAQDRYAGLLVSMHRSGLWRDRYGAIRTSSVRGPAGPMEQEIIQLATRLEDSRQADHEALRGQDSAFDGELWHNYRLLQVFDILSLYFCWNGYAEGGFATRSIAPVPVAYGSEEEVELAIAPVRPDAVRLSPYPFDISPLPISVRARTLEPLQAGDEEGYRAAFHRAPRRALDFEITE